MMSRHCVETHKLGGEKTGTVVLKFYSRDLQFSFIVVCLHLLSHHHSSSQNFVSGDPKHIQEAPKQVLWVQGSVPDHRYTQNSPNPWYYINENYVQGGPKYPLPPPFWRSLLENFKVLSQRHSESFGCSNLGYDVWPSDRKSEFRVRGSQMHPWTSETVSMYPVKSTRPWVRSGISNPMISYWEIGGPSVHLAPSSECLCERTLKEACQLYLFWEIKNVFHHYIFINTKTLGRLPLKGVLPSRGPPEEFSWW